MNKRLVVDVDLVLCDIIPLWIHWLINHTGYVPHELTPLFDRKVYVESNTLDYDITQYWRRAGRLPPTLDPWDFWRDKHLYDNAEPLPGAVEGLFYAKSQGWEIIATSHCKGGHAYSKHQFLKKHFPIDAFVATKEKWALCFPGPDCIQIDDRLSHLDHHVGCLKVLFPSPYKQDRENDFGATEIAGWAAMDFH